MPCVPSKSAERVVAIVVDDLGDIVEGAPDGVARPCPSGAAGVAIPPAAGDDVWLAVTVDIAGEDENRTPRLRVVDDVALPGSRVSSGIALIAPELDRGSLGATWFQLAPTISISPSLSMSPIRML